MSNQRARWIYAVELATATGLGVLFLLAVLALLHWIFPGGTGLGDLVRSQAGSSVESVHFAAGAEARVAVLKGVRHKVQDRPQNSVVWSKAAAGEALGDRHAVQTLESSSATIAFDAHAEIELGERSLIVIRKSSASPGQERRRASVLFMDGRLRTRIGSEHPGLGFEIATPSGTVHAQSQDGGVEVDLAVKHGKSELSVVEGTVELRWGETTTLVPEGFSVTYDATHAPSRPVPLDQPPRLVSPAAGARLSVGSNPKPVVLEWQAAEGGDYRLQIARDAAFEQLAFDQRVSGTRFVHDNLGPGEYHWRAARGATAAQTFSEPAQFVIVEDTEPPWIELSLPEAPVAGTRILLKGATEPGSRVFIGDAAATPNAAGQFEFPLEVREGYNFVVVQAIDPNGRVAFRNHTILARSVGSARVP